MVTQTASSNNNSAPQVRIDTQHDAKRGVAVPQQRVPSTPWPGAGKRRSQSASRPATPATTVSSAGEKRDADVDWMTFRDDTTYKAGILTVFHNYPQGHPFTIASSKRHRQSGLERPMPNVVATMHETRVVEEDHVDELSAASPWLSEQGRQKAALSEADEEENAHKGTTVVTETTLTTKTLVEDEKGNDTLYVNEFQTVEVETTEEAGPSPTQLSNTAYPTPIAASPISVDQRGAAQSVEANNSAAWQLRSPAPAPSSTKEMSSSLKFTPVAPTPAPIPVNYGSIATPLPTTEIKGQQEQQEDEEGEVTDLEKAFIAFASFGAPNPVHEMGTAHMAKLCYECNLLDNKFTSAEMDVLFSKVKGRGIKINFEQFRDEFLPAMASMKGTSQGAIEQQICSSSPHNHGTTPAPNKFHDDKDTYTGVYKAGGPKVVDDKQNHDWFARERSSDARGVTLERKFSATRRANSGSRAEWQD